jgi:serine/threonine-protein kinase
VFGARAITDSGGSTTGPLAQSQSTPSSSKLPLVLGGVLLLAAGGVGAYFVTRAPEAVPVPVQPLPTTVITLTAAAPSAQPSAPPTVVPVADAKVMRVRVVILPTTVSVEVEGQPVPTKNGLIEISGTPGSTHRVRLFTTQPKNEFTTDVVITDSGPFPPKVELPPPGAPRPTASAKAPTPTTPTAPPPPDLPKDVEKNFE